MAAAARTTTTPLTPHDDLSWEAELNALGARTQQRNDIDCVYTQPPTPSTPGLADGTSAHLGGKLYVGNLSGACSIAQLNELRITHVVNCLDDEDRYSKFPQISLLLFRISRVLAGVGGLGAPPSKVMLKMRPFFDFIDTALSSGGNVLIHCLAGAHRAGTASVAYLLRCHRTISIQDAILLAQSRRPIINPIGNFPTLLQKIKASLDGEPDPQTIKQSMKQRIPLKDRVAALKGR